MPQLGLTTFQTLYEATQPLPEVASDEKALIFEQQRLGIVGKPMCERHKGLAKN
jgi:hypothetical protein